uniref:SOGA coiled-coil domain-containing protein n=1 Tax=Cacopsylla melanoneura TaxID=428564 RepID=A0A8D8RVN1_9HEMI
MHHIKPTLKGDPLCPLGFHPQVRWPTRCKRCFRDYKEHGNRNKDNDLRRDDFTMSTPSLSSWSSASAIRESEKKNEGRSWTSTTNLSNVNASNDLSSNSTRLKSSSSWTSTPDLQNLNQNDTNNSSVTFTLPPPPRRRPQSQESSNEDEDDYHSTKYVVRRRTSQLPPTTTSSSSTTTSNSAEPSTSSSASTVRSRASVNAAKQRVHKPVSEKPSKADVDFILQVKDAKKTRRKDAYETDTESVAGTDTTDTTDTTLVNDNEYSDQIDILRHELDNMKIKCEKLEREKSDILLRRLASMETTTSKTTASELLKLQQRVNELKTENEDLVDDKKSLSLRVRELETENSAVKKSSTAERENEALRTKLAAAEGLCEELMDENEEMKKELRYMEEEMDEMQDHFREDQADEYSSLKKELEQTAKNCRILSFKLRKSERRSEQLEAEKLEAEKKCREVCGGVEGINKMEKIRALEKDLKLANETAEKLQKDLKEANETLERSGKPPKLGAMPKSPSIEKVSRETLTRGGSQEDPSVLMRDLQDSMEREADLREQLRFAEEEAQTLRKKISRVEDDNDSLALQLKKMATKSKTRRSSPQSRLTPEPPLDKDEGISVDDNVGELKLLLELNEQETSVLRRKVEETESDNLKLKKTVKELRDKIAAKTNTKKLLSSVGKDTGRTSPVQDLKIKNLEEEINQLKQKTAEKDKEVERLTSELSLAKKKPKSLQKSISLDGDQQTVDLKRQLQLVESEASILRTKTQSLESENETLVNENRKMQMMRNTKRGKSVEAEGVSVIELKEKIKTLETEIKDSAEKIKEYEEKIIALTNSSSKVDTMKTQMSMLEETNKKLSESLNRLKQDAIPNIVEHYKSRTTGTVRKAADNLTKVQLKRMVEELEAELSEAIVAMDKLVNSKDDNSKMKKEMDDKYKKEIAELNKKISNAQKELSEFQKINFSEQDKLTNDVKKLEQEKKSLTENLEKIESGKKALEETKEKLEEERNKLKAQVTKLNSDLKKLEKSKNDTNMKILEMAASLEEEKKSKQQLSSKLEETIELLESEKSKSNKDSDDKTKRLEELEKKLSEAEEKRKKAEKLVTSTKEKNSNLQKDIEKVRLESSGEKTQLTSELETLKSKLSSLESEKKKLETDITTKTAKISQLETSIREERERATDAGVKAGSAAGRELNQLREELTQLKKEAAQNADKVSKLEADKKSLEESLKSKETQMTKTISELETKCSTLEKSLTVEQKQKTSKEKELKLRESEISILKSQASDNSSKQMTDLKTQFEDQIKRFEETLLQERQEYEDLTHRYDILEAEHVDVKASLVKEKETNQSRLQQTQKELRETTAELKTLRDTYNSKQDAWIKEKLKMQEYLNSYEEKLLGTKETQTWMLEVKKLETLHDEKSSELEGLRKETHDLIELNEHMRKDNEELRKKLDDYERVASAQNSMKIDTSGIERELREAKAKVESEEKARKADVAAVKLRYDQRATALGDELKSIQGQVLRFKRERDTFKHMLEGAQKTIADLKASQNSPTTRSSISSTSEDIDELRATVSTLEQQISCMEDELSESRLETSRLKTELVSEKSAAEIKLSELTSKVNELEEDRLLSSGRTNKIPGLRTRMELAWHKEREEQQRLLQETSTLARDLRQTLFEVERERDKERLEAKRRFDQMKKTIDEEQDESRRKLNEMQCDLLELRDAHAKLRTTNEKLRREKEKAAHAQHSNSSRPISEDSERKVQSLVKIVEELRVLSPELFPGPGKTPPTPPVRRKGPKSRESSPSSDRRESSAVNSREPSVAREEHSKSYQLQTTLQRLTEVAAELKRASQLPPTPPGTEESQNRIRRAAFAAKKSVSTESDHTAEASSRSLARKGSLYRKSLSLEQTSQLAAQEQNIWKMTDDNDSSLTSFQSIDDAYENVKYANYGRRETSLDSRLSGGSTHSEVITTADRKKKGLFGKLKQLTRSSHSVDRDSDTSQFDPGSDTSLEESKGRLKDRLTGIFRKSGSSSRGNSVERKLPPSGNLSDSGGSRTLLVPRSSPSRSEAGKKVPPGSAPVVRKVRK